MAFRWMYLVGVGEVALAGYFYPLETLGLVAMVAGLAGVTWWLWNSIESPRYRRMARGECAQCGYDLRGVEGVCPECGWEFRRGRTWAAMRAE